MSIRKNVIYYIKKNIFIVLVLISLCPILALSYAKFTINSESYRSNEMYISELLYSIKIDNENTYILDVEPGETEHTIEITSLSGISTNYKLAYLNNDNLKVRYASDYMEASFGGIIMTRTISLTIKNTSNEKQTLSLMVFGGYSFNDIDEVKVLDTYTEIDTNYLHYDYETTALYVDNTRVDKLDSTKKYSLVSYTCSDNAKISYDTKTNDLTINTYNQTKCSLYFEEYALKNLCKDKTLASCLKDNYELVGITKISQAATGNQNYATTEYRYQGKTPNNYITFNKEDDVWRIIGIFETQTLNDSGYTKEYKVKIVRDAIGRAAWDYKTSSGYNNDWTTSTLMNLLNNGPYYNRTSGYTKLICSTGYETTVSETAVCDYSSNGLTNEAKNQISSTKWYLGNVVWTDRVGYGTTKEIYTQERSTSVYSGNSQTWNGKVALIYPSDYMYASSACYNDSAKIAFDYNSCEWNAKCDTDYRSETCKNTNWLLDTNNFFWTMSSSSASLTEAMFVSEAGDVTMGAVTFITAGLRPSLYLSSDVTYISGLGTLSDPFVIN
mgnify:FL=1